MGGYEKKLVYKVFSDLTVLNRLLNLNLIPLEMEMTIKTEKMRRKVDLIAYDEDNKMHAFLEFQLNHSDEDHLVSFTDLLKHEQVDNCYLIWIAYGFCDELLNKLKSEILKLERNIELHAISLNERILNKLYSTQLSELKLLAEFNKKIGVEVNDFSRIDYFANRNFQNQRSIDRDYFYPSPHKNAVVVSKILSEMRIRSELMAIHLYKPLQGQVRIGLGKDSVYSIISNSCHRQTIFFSVEFTNNYEVYNKVKVFRDEITELLRGLVRFDDDKLNIYLELPDTIFTTTYLTKFFAINIVELIELIYPIIND